MDKTTRFDAADYLDTEKRQAAYIAAALETGDADFVRDALSIVARARGMSEIAKKAGLNRESLYKALSKNRQSRVRHRHAHRTVFRPHFVCAGGVAKSRRKEAARRLIENCVRRRSCHRSG
jgi:probable addiction module antidote protein